MEKERYRLLGTVNVPENKREELNKYVQELLYKGGIRKSCEVVLDGKTYTTLKPVMPDENGIMQFDYSIFERKLRQVGTYDTDTCTLMVTDRGYNEYGLVMNLIMFLLEVYSQDMCVLMDGDEPVEYPRAYLRILKGLLGVEFFNDKRCRIWDMVYFLYQNKITDTISLDILNCMELSNRDLYWEQFDAYGGALFLEEATATNCEDIPKEKVASLKSYERKKFLYKILREKLSLQDEQFEKELMLLLNSNLAERQKMAERDDTIGMVAVCSLYMLPAVIVGGYAGIKKLTFWEAWETFGNRKYTDFLATEKKEDEKKKEEKEKLERIPFYLPIRREDENEFLEYWDGENLALSDKMKEYIELWQGWYKETEDIQSIPMEKTLAWVAEMVSAQYEAAYLDYDFVMEFLEHKDDKNYQKAVSIFRKTKEKDCWLFPELTVKQAQEEIIKYYQCAEDKIVLRAYQALLYNKVQRKRLFGF